jgi:hypothetical protein
MELNLNIDINNDKLLKLYIYIYKMPEEKRKQAEGERERGREGESVIFVSFFVWFGLVWFCVSSFLSFFVLKYVILFMAKVHPE